MPFWCIYFSCSHMGFWLVRGKPHETPYSWIRFGESAPGSCRGFMVNHQTKEGSRFKTPRHAKQPPKRKKAAKLKKNPSSHCLSGLAEKNKTSCFYFWSKPTKCFKSIRKCGCQENISQPFPLAWALCAQSSPGDGLPQQFILPRSSSREFRITVPTFLL